MRLRIYRLHRNGKDSIAIASIAARSTFVRPGLEYGFKREERPRMARILKILDPTILPIEISGCFQIVEDI